MLVGLVVALAAVAPALARTQKRHVTVVRGHGFSLSAWDRGKRLCFRLRSGSANLAACDAPGSLDFVAFQHDGATFVGGVVRRDAAKVVATVTDGKQLTMRTKRGSRYRGRAHMRFWAGRHAGSTGVKTLAAKSSSGATLEVKDVSPPAPPPPNPCGCGPPFVRVVCPLAPCPE